MATQQHSKQNLEVCERPILFSAPMVKAILAGTKTQTRRIVKPQPERYEVQGGGWGLTWGKKLGGGSDWMAKWCPYGKVGDRLWVRETFAIESTHNSAAYLPPFDDGRPIRHHGADEFFEPWWEQPHYRATDPAPELDIGTDEPGVKWKPSIFMPRWASRILLEITGVRVERVRSISEEDAVAEGVTPSLDFTAVMNYAILWRTINGPDSWAADPFVWILEFREVSA